MARCWGFASSSVEATRGRSSFSEVCWSNLRDQGLLVSAFGGPTLGLADIMYFAARFAKVWRESRRSPCQHGKATLELFRAAFLKWFAASLDQYVDHAYSDTNPDVERPPPALSLRRGTPRHYIRVTPEAAWDLMVKAREARSNLCQALALKKDESALGCHESAGGLWQNKFLQMYYQRCQMIVGRSQAFHHLCIVADTGHHSYMECLVSLAYSWELRAGCYPPWMHLVPGNTLAPGEVEMLDVVEEARRGNKLQRVAAFRQLQGISKQLHFLTNGSMSIDSFDLPDSCNVRPVKANERRAAFVEGGQRPAYDR